MARCGGPILMKYWQIIILPVSGPPTCSKTHFDRYQVPLIDITTHIEADSYACNFPSKFLVKSLLAFQFHKSTSAKPCFIYFILGELA
jgi:hypothetical protein